MFERPQLCHIDRLDQVGNQLGILKRHYKSYMRLIDRVVEPQPSMIRSISASHMATSESRDTLGPDCLEQTPMMSNAAATQPVALNPLSRVRFERLKDMIGLYALSEVKEYIAQKDSLVQMVSYRDLSLVKFCSSYADDFLVRTFNSSQSENPRTSID